jgi:uncharacterized protein (DUF2147 family)
MRVFNTALAALVATALSVPSAMAADAGSVIGKWRTPTRNGIVEISPCGSSICGRLVDSDSLRKNPNALDAQNKDESKRSRKMKGLQLLGGFKQDDGKWTDGSVYNPEDGGTYKGTVTPVDANTLKLKGCIVWPLCKTQTWKRVR